MLWGSNNERWKFVWHPWADKMLEASCEHKYLAVSGCRNAGKTQFYAIWAIVNFLCAPTETMVLVTSTSLRESRGRVWGAIEDAAIAAQHVCGGALPYKLVSSIGLIKFEDPTGEYKTSDRCGVVLIAGEKKKEKDAVGKIIGLKNERVFFIADELPELSHAILEAAFSNLSANPVFQLIGIGNPASYYDPHGSFSKPAEGWASVSPNDEEWKTERGYCIRFDAEKSPNVLAGRTIYKFLPTQQHLDDAKHELGEDSGAYWRMLRSFWNPNASSEKAVSEADIIKFGCEDTTVKWKAGTQPIKVTALDPSFTRKGDRSVRYVAEFGEEETSGKMVLLFKHYEVLRENIAKKDQPHNFQIVEQWRDKSLAENIIPENSASDDTGAAAFGDIVHVLWSKSVSRINSGGKATERPVSAENKKMRACDLFANRASEIFCSIKPFMRAGQIKGIGPDLGRELTERRMRPASKSGAVLREQVETKEDYRARVGKSPDICDAALLILDFVRTKYKFRAAGVKNVVVSEKKNWKDFRMRMGRLSETKTLDRAA